MRPLLPLLILLALAHPALASDGVHEINQTCAVQTGCLVGDSPGFPITIATSGSYALTSNLNVAASSVGGIAVTAEDVVIDLRGFTLSGPVSCVGFGSGVTCTGTSGSGILAAPGTHVKNGTVTGFGVGVSSNSQTIFVDRVHARRNSTSGIWAADGSRVSDSTASFNGGDGIQASRATVVDCTSRGNRERGVLATNASIVARNTISQNGTRGIDASNGGIFRDNLVELNGGIGISVRSFNPSTDVGSTVASNVVDGNVADGIAVWGGSLVIENTSTRNGQAGIAALAASSIQRNIVRQNTGFGLYLFPEQGGTAAAYQGNVVSANTGGTVINGVNLGGNSCNGTATCP